MIWPKTELGWYKPVVYQIAAPPRTIFLWKHSSDSNQASSQLTTDHVLLMDYVPKGLL